MRLTKLIRDSLKHRLIKKLTEEKRPKLEKAIGSEIDKLLIKAFGKDVEAIRGASGRIGDYFKAGGNISVFVDKTKTKWNDKKVQVKFKEYTPNCTCMHDTTKFEEYKVKIPDSVYKKAEELSNFILEIEETKREIEKILGSVTTTAKLITIWPEVEKDLKQVMDNLGLYDNGSQLPAVVIDEKLNKRLGLPPEEESDERGKA